MRRRNIAVAAGLALTLASCAQGGDDGPLLVGESGTTLCSRVEELSTLTAMADLVENTGESSVVLIDARMVDPQNIVQTSAGANLIEEGEEVIYTWPAGAEAAGSPETAYGPLHGFVVAPGAVVGVAVTGEVGDPELPASVREIEVTYRVGGRDYTELTDTTFRWTDDPCPS